MHVYIEDIGKHEGEEVTLKGWLHTRRSSGKIHFLIIRDGSGFIQAVMSKAAVGDEMFKAADHLSQETSLIVTGTVRADKRAPSGYEIDVKSIEVVGASQRLPDHAEGARRRFPAGSPPSVDPQRAPAGDPSRPPRNHQRGARLLQPAQGFMLADTPIFTPAACEGTTTLFPAQYFEDTTAYLTQSGQLYNEATAMALGRVYCFGPTFRAEKSKTRRHLTEFWMVEPEMAYADLEDVMELAEGLLVVHRRPRARDAAPRVEACSSATSPSSNACRRRFRASPTTMPSRSCNDKGLPFEWGGDFGGPDETALSAAFDRPVMVHRYPAAIKAFYMKPDPERPEVALGVDVLAPEGYGEIIGGGQRIDDLDLLLKRIEEHELPKEAFDWYIDLRRYGTVPHGGFGMGIERAVAWICGLEHVRETIPYPRMLYRLYP